MAGLYIHVPFCHSKCAYCDFFSRPCMADDVYVRYASAVIAEYSARRSDYLRAGRFATAYIGGGTPSVLPVDQLARIINAVSPDLDPDGEFTIECNPEDVTEAKVKAWKDLGINRVSMGIQSFSDEELRAVGRRHTAARAMEAVDLLRRCGVDNLSLDLIYGLPGQTLKSWKASLERLLSISPEHFSAYSLSLEPGTRLYAGMLAGKFTPADDSLVCDMYACLCEASARCGYEHYEISNLAKPGHRAAHNSSYWRDEAYLGLGPSAVSFDGADCRRTNSIDTTAYLRGDFSGADIEHESVVDRVNDAILVGLRTSDGLSLDHIRKIAGNQALAAVERDSRRLISNGMLEYCGPRHLRIPERQWLMADSVIRELIQTT